MYTYIHTDVQDYVELEQELNPNHHNIAHDWDSYNHGGWLLLSPEQLAFKLANPTANKNEVYKMELDPPFIPEPYVPTVEEKLREVNQLITPVLVAKYINAIPMDNDTALKYKELHPQWLVFINNTLSAGDRVQHGDKLFRVRQEIATVLANQIPGTTGMGALYEEINEVNAGTQSDPIPYDNVAGMELEKDKYYIQDGITYLCTRDSGQAMYHPLSALVNLYVQIA